MADPGSPVIDDSTAAALAAVFEALDWEADFLRTPVVVPPHPGGLVGHGTIRLHARRDAPVAPAPEPVGHGKIRLHGRDG